MLVQVDKQEEAVAAADECMVLCQHVREPILVGQYQNPISNNIAIAHVIVFI